MVIWKSAAATLAIACCFSLEASGQTSPTQITNYVHDDQFHLIQIDGIDADGLATSIYFRYTNAEQPHMPSAYRYTNVRRVGCSDLGSTNADWIEHYYQTILHRASDPDGKDYWTYVANNWCAAGIDPHQTISQIAEGFFTSPEYLASNNGDDAAFIVDQYMAQLTRPPEPGVVDYWFGQLAAGMTRAMLMTAIANSGEYMSRISSQFSAGGSTYTSPWYLVASDPTNPTIDPVQ